MISSGLTLPSSAQYLAEAAPKSMKDPPPVSSSATAAAQWLSFKDSTTLSPLNCLFSSTDVPVDS